MGENEHLELLYEYLVGRDVGRLGRLGIPSKLNISYRQ